MASEKQVAANRRNAAKSTGPTSAAGKQVARMNALKHGLQAEHVVVPGEDPAKFEALLEGLEEHYQPVGSLEHVLVERIACSAWRLQRANLIETAIMRREHWELEKSRAESELEKARDKLRWIVSVLDYDPDEDGSEEDEDESNQGCNLPTDEDETLRQDFERTEEAYNLAKEALGRADEELKSLSNAADEVFWASEHRLEKLSRYESSIERQLRNAIQDLERIQSARTAQAAEAAEVIDVTDLNRNES